VITAKSQEKPAGPQLQGLVTRNIHKMAFLELGLAHKENIDR
jgi:hypothetical protein